MNQKAISDSFDVFMARNRELVEFYDEQLLRDDLTFEQKQEMTERYKIILKTLTAKSEKYTRIFERFIKRHEETIRALKRLMKDERR